MPSLKHEIKLMAQIALPLMAAFAAQKGMQVVDTVMMGKIGTYALAAGSFASASFGLVMIFCMGTLSSVGVFISRALGANLAHEIKNSLPLGLCLALLLSLPGMVILWFAPNLLLLAGEDPRVILGVRLLLHACVLGLPGFLWFLVLREFVSAFALARVVMFVALGSIPLIALTNYILIYGKFCFPALGIAGIGYANALVQWLMFFSLLGYCCRHDKLKTYLSGIQFSKLPWGQLIDMLYIGVPSGLLFMFDVGMCMAAALIIGYFGAEALAAHQVALQCASLAYTFPFAISMATALRVSHALGAKDLIAAKCSAYLGLGAGLLIAGIIALLFILIPGFIISLFLNKHDLHYAEMVKVATTFLAIAAFMQGFDALQTIFIGALRGMKDTIVPMITGVLCYWAVGVTTMYILAFHTPLRATGVWYGLVLGIISATMVLAWRFNARFQRAKAMLQTHAISM